MSVKNITPEPDKNAQRLHVVSEQDYQLLRILKAAEESGRIVVIYPADGVVRGWVLIIRETKEENANG